MIGTLLDRFAVLNITMDIDDKFKAAKTWLSKEGIEVKEEVLKTLCKYISSLRTIIKLASDMKDIKEVKSAIREGGRHFLEERLFEQLFSSGGPLAKGRSLKTRWHKDILTVFKNQQLFEKAIKYELTPKDLGGDRPGRSLRTAQKYGLLRLGTNAYGLSPRLVEAAVVTYYYPEAAERYAKEIIEYIKGVKEARKGRRKK